MPLMLDDLRAEFAQHLASQPGARFSMDKALAHVLELAYQAGFDEAKICQGELAFLYEKPFSDANVAAIEIELTPLLGQELGWTNSATLLIRPNRQLFDESGHLPRGEQFVAASLQREEIHAIAAALDSDWADHVKANLS
jgi:hypothetical protein